MAPAGISVAGIKVPRNKSIVLAVQRRVERMMVIETLFTLIVTGETGR